MKIIVVAGARPNYMKVAPILRELDAVFVDAGQHTDDAMSGVFMRDLGLPEPKYRLAIGPGSHAGQVAKGLTAFEGVLGMERPDLVVVVGDVNSTLACALASVKCGVRVAHVEAGLRSFDMSMPEEVNRVVVDSISSLFFVTEESGVQNLQWEGRPQASIFMVGNTMIDSLVKMLPGRVEKTGRVVVTLHRPINVDDQERLAKCVEIVNNVAEMAETVFPMHPRTRESLRRFGMLKQVRAGVVPPMGYREFVSLVAGSSLVITDSGGIQEETTYLGVPCITLRPNTERPATLRGSNRLADLNPNVVSWWAGEALKGRWNLGEVPPLWDGGAGRRIAEIIRRLP